MELFILDKNLPLPVTETKAKKRKSDNDYLFPHLSVEKPDFKNMPSNFMICVNCWDLINSSEMLQRGNS